MSKKIIKTEQSSESIVADQEYPHISYESDAQYSLRDIAIIIIQWWKYLWNKVWIILLISVLGIVLGFIYASSVIPIYKAKLSFVLEDEKAAGGLSGALGMAGQLGIDVGGSGGGAFSGDNLLELMKSRYLVEKALLATVKINGKDQTLIEYYLDFKKAKKSWNNNLKLNSLTFLPNADRSAFTTQQDSILGKIYKSILGENLTVAKRDKKVSIIEVNVNSENELFAKVFAETLTRTVSDFYIQTKTKKSVNNLAILQYQTDSVRRALNYAISGVARSNDANLNANPAFQVLKVRSQTKQVDVQANTVLLTELIKNLEISKMSLRQETPLIQIIDKPILPLEKERLGKFKAMIVGGFLAGILVVAYFLFRKLIGDFIKDNDLKVVMHQKSS